MDKKFKVSVPVWTDIPIIIEANTKEEAMEKAKEIVFIGGNGEYQTTKLLFDHDRFTGGKLYDHTIDNFVKKIKKQKTDNGEDEQNKESYESSICENVVCNSKNGGR